MGAPGLLMQLIARARAGLARALAITASRIAPRLAVGQIASTYHDLLVQYRFQVVDRLESIYETYAAGDPSDVQDTFLIIEFADRPWDYVQCVFDSPTRLLCEAASGFFFDAPGQSLLYRLSASAIAALGRLGFSTDDSAGNFRIWLDITNPPDCNAIADFMLKVLHDGYGARADSKLSFNAPYAPQPTTIAFR